MDTVVYLKYGIYFLIHSTNYFYISLEQVKNVNFPQGDRRTHFDRL